MKIEIEITPEDLGGLLACIHSHGELVTDDEIVYRERDILKFLKKIGLPEPIWGTVVNIDKYEK